MAKKVRVKKRVLFERPPDKHHVEKDTKALMARGCKCWQCPLREQPIADSTGPEDAEFALCGIAPHYNEIKQGEPFVGPSGALLNQCLEYHGLNREDFFITNQVLCKPIRGTKPPDEAVAACHDRLMNEVRGKKVVTFGAGPTEQLTRSTKKLGDIRGMYHRLEDYMVLPTFHPSFALRAYPDALLDIRNDLERVVTGPYNGTPLEYFIARDFDDVHKMVNALLFHPDKDLVCDLETCNKDMERSTPERFWEGYILAMSFTLEPGTSSWVIPEELCQEPEVLAALKPVLERERGLIGANLKFDVLYFKHYYQGDIDIKIADDTFLMSYALDSRAGGHSLKDHAAWFDDRNYDDVLNKYVGEGKEKKAYAYIPRDLLYRYVATDTYYTFMAHRILRRKLEEENMFEWPYRQVLLRAQNMFADVERIGIYTFQDRIKAAKADLEPKIEQLTASLRMLSGNPDLNPGSSQQVNKFLYGEIGLKIPRGVKIKTKSGVSSADDVIEALLEEYSEKHYDDNENEFRVTKAGVDHVVIEFLEKLKKHRHLKKMLGSYVNKFWEALDFGSWSHYGYNLGRTETGRLTGSIAMTLPNEGDPYASKITRGCFGAPDSYKDLQWEFRQIVEEWLEKRLDCDPIEKVKLSDKGDPLGDFIFFDADYSQAEVRTGGFLSQDDNLRDVYESDKDIHTTVARESFGPRWVDEYPEEEPDKETSSREKAERTAAKRVVFGSMYGAIIETLVRQGIPRDAATIAFNRFSEWAWQFNAWRKGQFELAKTIGELRTPTGRKRRFPLITNKMEWHMKNQAYNFPVQSLANDIALLAFCEIYEYCKLNRLPIFPAVYLHDGLYFICFNDRELVEWFKNFVLETMESVAQRIQTLQYFNEFVGLEPFPFKADIELRRTWA